MEATAINDDLLSPSAIEDPHRVFAELREHDPVHWNDAQQAWLLTRYEDVSAAFQNKALSSDRIRPLRAMGRSRAGSAADQIHAMLSEFMVVKDPPEHTRLRRVAAKAFKQQRVAAMTERIDRLVTSLLDDFVASGEQDLIAGFAYPLPAIVIAEMLGAPPADRDRFRHWSEELALVAFGAGGEARPDRHERALRGLEDMSAYFRDLIAQRRADPGEDMISSMLAPDETAGTLSEDELVTMCALLLFAGHETTTNSIANGMWCLLHHPDQLAILQDDPDQIAPAVEELLRFEGPIKILTRWVVEDVEIGGQAISAGQRVHLSLFAANRDPERFPDPDVLDLTRVPNPHIAFGKGIHACIGAQVARIETRRAIARTVERLPGLQLLAEPEWKPVLAARAMDALHIGHQALAPSRA